VLFSHTAHLAMLGTAVVGTVVLGLSMRLRHTWSTVLIWVVPICLILSVTDGLLAALSTPFPSFAMDGGGGDWMRFTLCFLLLVFPCEIVYQLAVNWIADRFTEHQEGTVFTADGTGEEQQQ